MTRVEPHRTGAAGAEWAAAGARPTVAAPALTRIAALGIVLGVLVQAALAGGFLAGRSGPRDLHAYVGYALLLAAVVLLVAGLVGRRTRPEPATELGTRVALVLALTATILAGMRASRGSADLLMPHIPLAFAVAALATRLVVASRTRPRAPASERTATRLLATSVGTEPDRTKEH